MPFKSDFFNFLAQFLKGNITGDELAHSQKGLWGVIEKNPRGESVLEFDLNYEDEKRFLKALGLSDDDIYLMNSVYTEYSSGDFYDLYYIQEDFDSGNFFNWYLTDFETLKKVAEIIYPNEPFDVDNNEYNIKLNDALNSMFPQEVEYMISDVFHEKNSSLKDSTKDKIEDQIKDFLGIYGIESKSFWNRFNIKASTLKKMYYVVGDDDLDPIDLLRKYFDGSDRGIGGWGNDIFDFEDASYFNTEYVNREINRQLDKILDKIEDENEHGFQAFIKMRNRVLSKFKFGSWYKLPKSGRYGFIIRGFDRDKMKIIVGLEDYLVKKGIRKLELSEENFNHLLYQPTLFDFEDV